MTIEDAAELMLRQRHVVRLETRPANIEGKGAVRQRQLVINALRMRPDRIIVGEVRGEEALDMLQAMNTGHDGSLTTIHANSPRDALYRLDTMVAMANLNIPEHAVRQQIASAVNLVVQVSRMSDGTRKVTSISEITGMEQDVITMQEIFAFQKTGIDADGRVIGTFRATGIRPKCSEALADGGHAAADGDVRAPAADGRRPVAAGGPRDHPCRHLRRLLRRHPRRLLAVRRPAGAAALGIVRTRLTPTQAVKASCSASCSSSSSAERRRAARRAAAQRARRCSRCKR